METEIYTYYQLQTNKRKIFEDLTNQLEDGFSKQENKPSIKKIDGCKYLHIIRFKDLNDWKVRGLIKNELSDAEKSLIDKILYMCGGGNTSFTDAINMLKRIVTKGMKGCLNGKGKDMDFTFDQLNNETRQEFINRVAIGHFYHNHGVWKLTEQDVECIKNVLERNNLLI